MKRKVIRYAVIFREAFKEFANDNVMKLSASLSYFTIFSLAPMLVVIISLCGLFFGKDAVEGELFEQIRSFVGDDAAMQIQNMIGSADLQKGSYIATVIGLITILIGATGVFSEIQSTINSIWGVKPKPKRGFIKLLFNRLMSFVIVIVMGFVALVSLALNGLIVAFSDKITQEFPWFSLTLANTINSIFTYITLSILFAIIFKVLPDAKIKWKDVGIGALFTGFLFMLGKWGIGLYLTYVQIGSTYGAASSLVVILLWVYYSAIILYFGAEFTQAYANHKGSGIVPKDYAVFIKFKEVRISNKTNGPK